MSRLRSSANFTASSSVRRTTGGVAVGGVCGTCSVADGCPICSAACLISSLMRASETCCAETVALVALSAARMAAAQVSITCDPFRVITSVL